MCNIILKRMILSALCIASSGKIHAQVVEEWVRRFEGYDINYGRGDYAYAIAIDSSGNIYVTGLSGRDTLDTECATVKYDNNGNQIWVAWYDGQPGIGLDRGIKIFIDNVGYVYVIGKSEGIGTYWDYFTVKYDTAGNEVWSSRYYGPGDSNDIPTALAEDVLGNVYVTGYSWGHPDSFTDYDWATVKYDSNGNEQWVRRYNGVGNYNDIAYALAVDQTGNVYVSGETADLALNPDATTIKYDSSGNEVWVVVEDFRMDGGSALVLDSNENPLIAGILGPGDAGAIKYNKVDGTDLKLYQYDGGSVEDALHIELDSWGNVIVAGGIYRANWDFLTVKFDSAGNVLWANEWNGPNNYDDFITALAIDPMGNVAVTGKTTIFGNWLKDDYATVKYDSSGNQLWEAIYNGPADDDDEANGVVMDAFGNVYVTGFSDAGIPTGYDYTTIKYVDVTGVEEEIRLIESSPFSISPNPFWSVTTIQGRGEFKVYDLMGRLRGRVEKGPFGGELPAGVYIIQQGDRTKKIVKIR